MTRNIIVIRVIQAATLISGPRCVASTRGILKGFGTDWAVQFKGQGMKYQEVSIGVWGKIEMNGAECCRPCSRVPMFELNGERLS